MRCDRCNKLLTSSGADAIHTCSPPAIVAELESQIVQLKAVHPHACMGAFERLKVYSQHLQESRDAALNRETDLRAKLAQAQAERDSWRDDAERERASANQWQGEAEEAQAQVAALVAETHLHCDGCEDEACGGVGTAANLPAAAERYLAAQRVAEACDAFRKGDAPRVLERVAERKRLADAIDEALEVWRQDWQS